jgi:penicillin-binding protein 2
MLAPFRIRHEVTHISPETYEAVQLGMQDVVDHGTARVARLQGISVAAKTGTAENYGIIGGKRVQLDDHSWFVAFAPRENPRIAIAVIVENAGFGATWAGPIASLLMERYLTDTLRPERLAEVERIAAKEIMLPVIRQKRARLDSLRRLRMRDAETDTMVLPRMPPRARIPSGGAPRPVAVIGPADVRGRSGQPAAGGRQHALYVPPLLSAPTLPEPHPGKR